MTYTGFLRVEAGNKGNRSIVTNSFFDGVLKITRPIYISKGLPLLTMIHVGGGYVDGDSYHTEVVVHEAARLALTTQASTKVYKSRRFGVSQTMDYFVKSGSELYVKQDPLILYKDACFTQSVNVYMNSTASFYYTDIITPGWSEDGKLFSYYKISSKMKIFMDGSLEVFDHLLFEPNGQLEELMHMEGFTHLGTLFFLHEKTDDRFIDMLRAKLSGSLEHARFGASMLSVKGMTVRILANSTTAIERLFTECERFIRERLFNNEEMEWRKG